MDCVCDDHYLVAGNPTNLAMEWRLTHLNKQNTALSARRL